MKKPHKKCGRSNFSIAQQIAYDNHLFAVADINQTRIESFDKGFEEGVEIGEERGIEIGIEKGRDEGRSQTLSIFKDLQEGNLSHLEIASKHGVELQVVNEIADKLK